MKNYFCSVFVFKGSFFFVDCFCFWYDVCEEYKNIIKWYNINEIIECKDSRKINIINLLYDDLLGIYYIVKDFNINVIKLICVIWEI